MGDLVKDPSSASGLDRIDLKLLRLLQAEGRLTNAELAQRVSVSPATCHRRTQRLMREGFIRGVRAMVAPGAAQRGSSRSPSKRVTERSWSAIASECSNGR